MENGWDVELAGGFIPSFEILPANDHPLTFVLDDGRVYEFDCYVQTDNTLASILPVMPTFPEVTFTGATLDAMRADFSVYSTTSFDDGLVIGTGQDTIFEDYDFASPWEPRYYRLNTEVGEHYIFDADTFQVAKFTDTSGYAFSRSDSGIQLDGRDALHLDYAADGMISKATNTLTGDSVTYTRDGVGDSRRRHARRRPRPDLHVRGGVAPRVVLHRRPRSGALRVRRDGPRDPPFRGERRGHHHRVRRSEPPRDRHGRGRQHRHDAVRHRRQHREGDHPLGNVTTYTHAPGTDHETSRTDPLGHTWQAAYDARGRRIGTVDPLGDTITIGYDVTTGRQTTAVDGEGRTFTELTDANGRVTAFQMPDGTVVRSFSYPDPSTIVSADAHGTTTTTYDSRGRVISVTDGAGTRTTTYDDVHHTATFTAADGSVSSGTLDALQRFTTLNTASGGTFHYTYGPTPAVDQVTRPDGVQMKFEHSSGGQQTGLTIGGKPVQKVTYNSLGLLASVSQNGETKSYAYDPTGRVSQMTTAQGAIAYGYDAAGRLTDVTSSDGVSRVIAYDDANRPIGIDNGAGQRLEIAYDRSSRITGVADQNGRTYAVGYDADGRRDSIVYPGGVGASWTYVPSDDEETPPLATLDGPGGRELGLRLRRQRPARLYYRRRRQHDELRAHPRRLRLEDCRRPRPPHGLRLERQPARQPDHAGRQDAELHVRRRRPHDRVDPRGRLDGRLRVHADERDHPAAERRGLRPDLRRHDGCARHPGRARRRRRHAAQRGWPGRPGPGRRRRGGLGPVHADGKLGSVTASTPGGAVFTTRYAYDSAARISQITDPDGGVTRYTYDAQGRITRPPPERHPQRFRLRRARPPDARPALQRRDARRELRLRLRRPGRVVSLVSPEGSFAYQYDALGRLAVEQTLSGATVVASKTRTYDAVGNLLTLVDSAAGTTTYTYDVDDRLLSVAGPTDTTTYGYDLRGASRARPRRAAPRPTRTTTSTASWASPCRAASRSTTRTTSKAASSHAPTARARAAACRFR